MKKFRAVDALFWMGAGLISAGVGLFCPALGVIAAGIFCLAASFLSEGGEP